MPPEIPSRIPWTVTWKAVRRTQDGGEEEVLTNQEITVRAFTEAHAKVKCLGRIQEVIIDEGYSLDDTSPVVDAAVSG